MYWCFVINNKIKKRLNYAKGKVLLLFIDGVSININLVIWGMCHVTQPHRRTRTNDSLIIIYSACDTTYKRMTLWPRDRDSNILMIEEWRAQFTRLDFSDVVAPSTVEYIHSEFIHCSGFSFLRQFMLFYDIFI